MWNAWTAPPGALPRDFDPWSCEAHCARCGGLAQDCHCEDEMNEQQQLLARLQWLCDRVQEQIPHHWEEGAKASDATHDRLACTEEFHSGCHKYALVETARRLGFLLADAQKDHTS